MKSKLLLFLLLVMGARYPLTATAKQNAVAQATQAEKLHALAEKLRARDKADRRQAGAWADRTGAPLRRQLPNGRTLELQRLAPGRGPQFYVTFNVDAADTVSTDELWPGGSTGLSLDGSGMRVGEWDAGAILADHPDLYGRVNQVDGVIEISDHSTHVAGTLIGAGTSLLPQARGMAFGAQLDAYDWNADTTEMAAAAAAGLLLSNHSYGIAAGWLQLGEAPPNNWWWMGGVGATEDPNFGYYDTQSQLWDQIAADAPYYLIVKAAGNDRWDFGPPPGEQYTLADQAGTSLGTSTDPRPADCTDQPNNFPDGYDCLPAASVAKNVLTIGAVDDVPGGYVPLAGPSQVQVTGFSGWGPTDDGRIKPDLVGNGWLLMSTYGHDPYFAPAIGTSMAGANVTGSLLLLQQHYHTTKGNFMRAATLKALAIHTADEAGDANGPDYRHGWGLLNTRVAAAVITGDGGLDHNILENTLADGETVTIPFTVVNSGSTLKVTLGWTDPPGTPVAPSLDPADSMLVNDLDLRVSESGATHMPWVLNPSAPEVDATTGDNSLDNVEQVVVYDAPAGSYVIHVNHKGALQNGTNQDFSLVISAGPGAQTSQGLLLDEDFSDGMPAGWSVDTAMGVSWNIINHPLGTPNPTGATGNYAMVSNNGQFTQTSLRTPGLNLSNATEAVLRFNSFFYFDTFETINVDVSVNGGASWSNAWSHQGFSNIARLHTVNLTPLVAGQTNVSLRFRFQSSVFFPDGRYWQIDNIELEAFGTTPATVELPGQAQTPGPYNGATGVDVNTSLSWIPGALAQSHDIYFATNSGFTGASPVNQNGASYNPGTLSYDTTYYWRVDSVNSGGTTPGATWSFTTASSPPGCN